MLRVFVLAVVVLGCVLTSYSVCRAQVYYVKPSQPPNITCPGKPCHTLNYYAQNATSLLSGRSNVTLLFVEGVHFFTEPNNYFEISETTNVTLMGISIQIPSVRFSAGGRFNFTVIDELVISHLFFLYDSVNHSESACETTVSVSHITRFSHDHINSTGVCLNLEVTREFQLYSSSYTSGAIYYTDQATIDNTHKLDSISMSIHQCSFDVLSELSINLNSASNTTFNGVVSSSYGVAIRSSVASSGFVHLSVNDCHKLSGGVATIIFIWLEAVVSKCELRVEGSTIESIGLLSSQIQKNAVIGILNSSFFFGEIHCANVTNVVLSQLSLSVCNIFLLTKECRFENITVSNSPPICIGGPATAHIDGCVFENGTGDNYSPLILSFVEVYFYGTTVFRNNNGYQGGAIYLFNSKIYLTNQSEIIFQNNIAQNKGGAVYIQNPIDNELKFRGTEVNFRSVDIKRRQCVFSLSYNLTDGERPNSSVTFKENSAVNGGSDIYGTSLKSDCFVTPNAWQNFSYEVQSDVFKFDSDTDSNFSSVSSDPTRVCFCDDNGRPMCAAYSYIVRHRKFSPGEKFNVSLALVGGDFGVTGGTVHTLLFKKGKTLPFKNQSVKILSGSICSLLEYEVYSDNENSTVLLYFGSDVISIKENIYNVPPNKSLFKYHDHCEIDDILATTPVLLNITLQKCPLGLALNKDTSSCNCVPKLTDYGITTCAPVNGDGLITRGGTIWVSHSGVIDNETTGVVAYKYCPFDYCETGYIVVNLTDPDRQCAFNHSGVLCGGCFPPLSLALGSPQCLPCSDNGHMVFFIPFAIAGLVLVLFIKLLDLTITKGAVNGLLLYANIVWTNQSIFFPHSIRQSSLLFHFFTTFVAWLNLDLGIETCFIQGLDMYWKTWLQFLFPLYIWSLAGLIILACRYSDKATNVFGNNSVHVLATLFLLSYSKLLRTIITSLGVAILDYPDGTRAVWLADGNLPYFGVRHSFLFIAAIFALIVFWLPYTVTILLVPWLRKCGNISWVNKLKPFFDAHYGPLKDKHQYWIGLTLLVRVILAITDVAIQAVDPTINLLVTIALSSLLLYVVGFSYRKWYLSILDASFVANVIILGGAFLYTSNQNVLFQTAFAIVSVGIAFLTFLVIICVQGYTQLKTLRHCRIGVHREYENITGLNDSKTECVPPTHSVVSLNDETTPDYYPLREELLESDGH